MFEAAPAPPENARRHWMSVLARASADEIAAASGGLPAYRMLRAPQTGMVMLRGRAGGTGAAFNLGEATVTRCSVRLETGAVGHAYVLGRDARQAELAAVLDAVLQEDAGLMPVIDRLATVQAARREKIAARAAATKVEFFTMSTMRT